MCQLLRITAVLKYTFQFFDFVNGIIDMISKIEQKGFHGLKRFP